MENFFKICEEKLNDNSELHRMGSALFGLGVGKMVTVNLDSNTLNLPGSDHKNRSVHRMALMVKIQNLDIPPILQASHLCNVKYCINTEYLTLEDNQPITAGNCAFLIGIVSVMEMERCPALSIWMNSSKQQSGGEFCLF